MYRQSRSTTSPLSHPILAGHCILFWPPPYYILKCTRTHSHAHSYTHPRTHTRTCMCTRSRTCTCMHACTHSHTLTTHMYTQHNLFQYCNIHFNLALAYHSVALLFPSSNAFLIISCTDASLGKLCGQRWRRLMTTKHTVYCTTPHNPTILSHICGNSGKAFPSVHWSRKAFLCVCTMHKLMWKQRRKSWTCDCRYSVLAHFHECAGDCGTRMTLASVTWAAGVRCCRQIRTYKPGPTITLIIQYCMCG